MTLLPDPARVLSVAAHIDARRQTLTPAEGRVASVILGDPESVAFGTVAVVAEQSRTSNATVVRLAGRLGYDGFPGLQRAVRRELLERLHRSDQRHGPELPDLLARVRDADLGNVERTIDQIDRGRFDESSRLLSGSGRPGTRVFVLSGDSPRGMAVIFTRRLSALRPGVELVGESAGCRARALMYADRGDVVVAFDAAPHDDGLVQAVRGAGARGMDVDVVVIADTLSPLAVSVPTSFIASTVGVGTSDSHVGMLALVDALVHAVSTHLDCR